MGRDKSSLVLAGQSLLDRVRANVAPVVSRLRLVGRVDAGEAESIPDLYPGLGPLAGIHAALVSARSTAVLVVACDLPFATSGFLSGLVAHLGPSDLAVVPCPETGPVPVCAVYRTACAEQIEGRLRARELSARAFVAALPARLVRGPELSALDPAGVALSNVNTPEDFENASRLAQR
jgi:molybdopterin-guanine dinucleotide biosynthesis protein A